MTKSLTREDVIAMLTEARDEHAAMITAPQGADLIQAWHNGLGLKIGTDGKPMVVSVLKASAVTDACSVRPCWNGAHEFAELMTRAKACEIYLPTLEACEFSIGSQEDGL